MELKKSLKRIFEGILIGVANIIPGVSGGTMALITGIYDRLVHSINTIPLRSPLLLLKGDITGFKKKMSTIDFSFLAPLGIGVLVATLFLARQMEPLLENYPAPINSFFFGLIFASVGVIYKYIDEIHIYSIVSAAGGFFFALFLGGLQTLQANHSLPIIFLSGMVAIVSMILPGISGSFILVFLRQYKYMLHALNTLNFLVISVFMVGAVIGLFGFAKLLDYLIQHRKSVTMAFLFGLMLGALRVPAEKAMAVDPSFIEVILPAAVGAAFVAVLESYYLTERGELGSEP